MKYHYMLFSALFDINKNCSIVLFKSKITIDCKKNKLCLQLRIHEYSQKSLIIR